VPRALILVLLGLCGAPELFPADFGVPEPLWALSAPDQPVEAGAPFVVTARVSLPPGYYQDVESAFLAFEPIGDVRVLERTSSAPTVRDGKKSFTGTFTLTRSVVLPATTAGLTTLSWKTGWQICQTDGICLLPAEKRISLAVRVVAAATVAGGGPRLPLGLDFWGALLGAFLGGLLLNLMPCVFPVLALKAVGIASASGETRRERRRDALAFAAGGWGVLTLLGGITAGFSAFGQRLDWGFTFQEPWFVWALVLVFWAFTLQLWGVWTWRGSPFAFSLPTKPGWIRSLAGGGLLVLAAAPCTAPLLGPALGFAFAQPPGWIPLFFSMAGLGLVLPLVVLQFLPGWAHFLPKPGPWMVLLERIAGFFLAATVLYLLWVLTKLTSVDRIWFALTILGTIAGLFALVFRFPSSVPIRVLGMVLGAGLLWLSFPLTTPSSTPVSPTNGWQSFSFQALNQAREAGRPVLVDATAAWCATCQVNELAVLDRPDVTALLERQGVVRLRADYTRPDPAIRDWLTGVNRAGLPVYALYRPGRPVYLFPELLTDDNFTRVFENLEKDTDAPQPRS